MAPDGVAKEMYVFNNSFPGPTIEANWGDTIVVHVQNNLQNNGYTLCLTTLMYSTSVHWHGLLQHGTAANDGVPGVTQCKNLDIVTNSGTEPEEEHTAPVHHHQAVDRLPEAGAASLDIPAHI